MIVPEGFYWTGWLQLENSTELIAQWQIMKGFLLYYTIVHSKSGESEQLKEQKKENALNSLIEAVK